MNSGDQMFVAIVMVCAFFAGMVVRRLWALILLAFLVWIPIGVYEHCGAWLRACTASKNHTSWLVLLPVIVAYAGGGTLAIALAGRWFAAAVDTLFARRKLRSPESRDP
ncbi:MAG: hypothetical protein JNJ55_04710 [Betaproteobacteria bacterium]|nr:hypothetical protein [Betaproteobacteria bacterium]